MQLFQLQALALNSVALEPDIQYIERQTDFSNFDNADPVAVIGLAVFANASAVSKFTDAFQSHQSPVTVP